MNKLASLALSALLSTAVLPAHAAANFQMVDLATTNHSLYDMTNGASYPAAGDYLAFDAIPYRIGGAELNIWHSTNVNSPTQVLDQPINVFGATHVYTVMNLWFGVSGTNVATVEFFGSGGASYSQTLVVGTDIRDHFNGGFSNTINGTTTVEIFSANGVRLDRQAFALPSAFASQTLERMVVTNLIDPNDYPLGQAFVAAVTVAAVPEPETYGLMLAGLALVGWAARRRSQRA